MRDTRCALRRFRRSVFDEETVSLVPQEDGQRGFILSLEAPVLQFNNRPPEAAPGHLPDVVRR